MIKVYKLSHNKLAGNCTTDDLKDLFDDIEFSEPGETWTIEVKEMQKEDFDKLPEFTGW